LDTLGLNNMRLKAQHQADRDGPRAGQQSFARNQQLDPKLSPNSISRSGVEWRTGVEKLVLFSDRQFNKARAPTEDSRGAKRPENLLSTRARSL